VLRISCEQLLYAPPPCLQRAATCSSTCPARWGSACVRFVCLAACVVVRLDATFGQPQVGGRPAPGAELIAPLPAVHCLSIFFVLPTLCFIVEPPSTGGAVHPARQPAAHRGRAEPQVRLPPGLRTAGGRAPVQVGGPVCRSGVWPLALLCSRPSTHLPLAAQSTSCRRINMGVTHQSPLCPRSDPAKYLSALLLSLNTMLHLELPQVR